MNKEIPSILLQVWIEALYSGLLCVQRPITSLNMTQSAKVLFGGVDSMKMEGGRESLGFLKGLLLGSS